MKKYIATSLVLVGAASLCGVAIGLSAHTTPNSPVQLINKAASVTQNAPTTTDTQTATQAAPSAPVAPTTTSSTSTTTTSSPSTATTPVTITAVNQIPLADPNSIDCEYTYSDGTTYQWHWQTVNPQGSWQTNPDGSGQWNATTSWSGKCDAGMIGAVKTN